MSETKILCACMDEREMRVSHLSDAHNLLTTQIPRCRGQIACYLSGTGRRSFPSCPKPGGLHLHHQHFSQRASLQPPLSKKAERCSALVCVQRGIMYSRDL